MRQIFELCRVIVLNFLNFSYKFKKLFFDRIKVDAESSSRSKIRYWKSMRVDLRKVDFFSMIFGTRP